MEWLFNTLHYIVPFIVLLGVLVFVHEFGHFIIARLCGVAVTDFSIGFGKKIFGFKDKHGTEWKICAIPLGGYCQFLGDADASSATNDEKSISSLSDEQKKVAFPFQSPWKKLAIVLGGPSFNYLFAILIFTAMFSIMGKITFPPIVGEVLTGSAAETAGIASNDRIVSINGHNIKSFSDIPLEIALVTDGNALVKVERNGEIKDFTVTLTSMDEQNQQVKKPMLGIKSVNAVELDMQKIPVHIAFVDALNETWKITDATLRGVGQMITGQRGGEDIGGIIRIAEMSGDISKKSGILEFIMFMSLLSINLGLINLFPIPVLDGGHVVIYLIEIATGRELNNNIKDKLFKFGLAIIISLMIFATWNDVVHLFKRFFA